MNILYLHSHDTGRWVQPYGFPVRTPALMNLARQGTLFRHAFCAAPTCSPSRAALLTGQNPHSAGMLGLAHRGFQMTDHSRLLPNVLKSRLGYETALFGIQHTAADAAELGYDHCHPAYDGELITAHTEAFLADPARSRTPFFASVGYFETHRLGPDVAGAHNKPELSEGDPAARYAFCPPGLPDTPETRRDFADFAASAARLDAFYARVLAALDRSALAHDTLVIATTDHGPAFPAMKCSLTDAGTGVLLILRGGPFTGGRVLEPQVSHLDLFPTLCDLLRIPAPTWLEGRSLLPLLASPTTSVPSPLTPTTPTGPSQSSSGATRELHDELFSEVTYHAAYEPMRAIRTPRYKLIRRFPPHDAGPPILPNTDNGLSKRHLLAVGWAHHAEHVPEQLYDLTFDPEERINLAASPAHREILESLRLRLHAWMERTQDPLLQGPVPTPPNAQVTPPTSLHP